MAFASGAEGEEEGAEEGEEGGAEGGNGRVRGRLRGAAGRGARALTRREHEMGESLA